MRRRVAENTYGGIGRTAHARAVVDAAERGCVLCAGPVLEAVDGLVAHVPDAEVLFDRTLGQLGRQDDFWTALTVNPSSMTVRVSYLY